MQSLSTTETDKNWGPVACHSKLLLERYEKKIIKTTTITNLQLCKGR
jgi:hypothetical protein